jgi:hypothetical protein
MQQFEQARFRIRRLPWWQGALLGAVAIAAIIAVAIVATGLVLILVPIVFVAILVHRFLARRAAGRADRNRAGRLRVIDAEYEVISGERSDGAPRDQESRR